MSVTRRDPHEAPSLPAPEPTIWSVAAFDRRLGRMIERATEDVHIGGEVGGVKAASSGHTYFTLKDEREDASLEAVLYRSAPVRARKLLVDGARLVVKGRATVFVPRGRLQLVVDDVRPAGRGALLEALERLKKSLAAEGLFDPARKRPLPRDPRVVGVVTSAQGAALADIVTVAFRRGGARILLSAAPVQGPDAARRMVRALSLLAEVPEVDAVILGRGGGSAEDLAAYNDEALVRRIASMPVPVVSAVGHEIDMSLTDLVADARAATPSEAAALLIPDAVARRERLSRLEKSLGRAMERELSGLTQRVDDARTRLSVAFARTVGQRRDGLARLERRLSARHPSAVIAQARGRVQPLSDRLRRAMEARITLGRGPVQPLAERLRRAMDARLAGARRSLARDAGRLDALSPLAVLERGYSIARGPDGRAIVDAGRLSVGDVLEVRVARGRLGATVTWTEGAAGQADAASEPSAGRGGSG